MINAKEALAQSEIFLNHRLKKELEDLEEKIKETVRNGDRSFKYVCDIAQENKNILVDLGYKVKLVDSGYIISW